MRNSTFQVDFTICFSLFLPTSLLVVLFFFYLSLFSAQLHFLPAVLEQLTQFQIAFSSPCPRPLGVLLLPMTPLHLSLPLQVPTSRSCLLPSPANAHVLHVSPRLGLSWMISCNFPRYLQYFIPSHQREIPKVLQFPFEHQ